MAAAGAPAGKHAGGVLNGPPVHQCAKQLQHMYDLLFDDEPCSLPAFIILRFRLIPHSW